MRDCLRRGGDPCADSLKFRSSPPASPSRPPRPPPRPRPPRPRPDLLARSVAQTEDAVGAVKQLIEAEKSSRLDLIQVEGGAERLRADLESAEAEYPAAVRRLAAAVGVPEADLGLLSGSLDPPFPAYDLDRTQ